MACHWEDSDTVVQELFSNVGDFSDHCGRAISLTAVLSGLSDMYLHRVCDTDHLTSLTDATHTHEQIHSLLEIPLQ